MSDLIESYKKEAEILDQKFLELFREKVKLYDNFRTNLLLESDVTLHYTSYTEVLDLIKKYAYDVRVGDWVKYNRSKDSSTSMFFVGDDLINLKKIIFYFNEEVEKYCKDNLFGKYVYVNVDENINSNVFLGTVVDIAFYVTDPKIFIDEPETNMRCDEDISGENCDKPCCGASRIKFVETIRTINSQNPFPSSIRHNIDNSIRNSAEESLHSFQTDVPNTWINIIFDYYVSEGFIVTRGESYKYSTILMFEW